MSSSVIAAQLYTVRDFLKTPADIAASLKKIKNAGYEAVQLSGLGKIGPKELASILAGEGLTCCATHQSLERFKNEPAEVIEEHHILKCKYSAIGYFTANSADAWRNFANQYNSIASQYRESGLSIGYHNHSHELARFDGSTALQILVDRLDKSVFMEIDTYWITHGGGDPAHWIGKLKGRIPCVHLKDMAVDSDRKQFMAEVGEGNLNWPAILTACKHAGVEWYIVEQDTCRRDPFESLKISLGNLKEMGLR